MSKPALAGAIKILVDGGKDVVAAIKPGQSLSQKIAQFENLIPDAVAEVAVIANLSDEIKNLQPQDYADLGAAIVTDLGLTDPHAQAVAAASLKLVSDAVQGIPDVLAFLHALKTPA